MAEDRKNALMRATTRSKFDQAKALSGWEMWKVYDIAADVLLGRLAGVETPEQREARVLGLPVPRTRSNRRGLPRTPADPVDGEFDGDMDESSFDGQADGQSDGRHDGVSVS